MKAKLLPRIILKVAPSPVGKALVGVRNCLWK